MAPIKNKSGTRKSKKVQCFSRSANVAKNNNASFYLNYMIRNFFLQLILNVLSNMFNQSKGTLPFMNESLFSI